MKRILFLLGIVVFGGLFFAFLPQSIKDNGPVACTMDAKICPDGSAVGRTGPKCEFGKCPDVVATSTPPIPTKEGNITLGIGQEGRALGLSIFVNKFIQDSRCPMDVLCIQAGSVTVGTTLQSGSQIMYVDIDSDKGPVNFAGYEISIKEVFPLKRTQETILESDYRITFHVIPIKKSVSTLSAISGKVTLSPICPVERMPREPGCDPKPYATSIKVLSTSGKILKTIQSKNDGTFAFEIGAGEYTLQAVGGNPLPRCEEVAFFVREDIPTTINISCDTGIR